MGIDVELYFEKIGDLTFEWGFPPGWNVVDISARKKEDFPDATHEFDTLSRYYGKRYERGCWPDICAVLMLLHACPGVGKVWYGGDSGIGVFECSPDDVVNLSRHFMKIGVSEWASTRTAES